MRRRSSRPTSWLLPVFLLAALGLPTAAHKGDPADELDGQEAQEAEGPVRTRPLSKTREMLVHLASGHVFRGKARQTTGGWEILRGDAWIGLPAESVVRARVEKEVLAEARKLDRESRRGDGARRAAYADWLLSEGLYPEGLKVLDALLRDDPDHRPARDVLARHDPPVALPRAELIDTTLLDQLIATCAKGSPSVQEIAAQRLSDAPEVTGLEDRLLDELHAKRGNRRSFATLALRRVFPGRHVRPLITRAVLDVSDEVRMGAALALGEVGDPAVAVPAIRALGSKNGTVRKNAAEALGHMSYKAAVGPLVSHLSSIKKQSGATSGAPRSHIFVGKQFAYVQDFDVEVAQGSAVADPIINVLTPGVVLEAASVGVHETSIAQERSAIRRSLSRLTGADPGDTTAAWERWWTEHGDDWKADLPPGPPSTPVRRGN